MIILFYLLFVVGVGVLAGSWSRNGILWAVVAAFVSPLLAVLILLAIGKATPASS